MHPLSLPETARFAHPAANCKAIWESSIRAEAYWRVYQDWRSWTEEGILDIAVPMNYKREHVLTPPASSQALMFDEWNEWTKNHRYNRSTLVGVGNFLNAVEGNVRQVRRSLQPSAQGNSSDGVVFFSMATSNVAVPANPWSVPPGASTPLRSFADFALGLTAGKSGATLFEPNANDPGFQAIFAEPATIPVHAWKSAPTRGHLKGFPRRADTTVLDTATVTITNLDTNAARSGATDGGGFYGGVDLTPGSYLVKAELGPDAVYSCVSNVSAGLVTTADLSPETIAPVTSAVISPSAPDGANGWYVTNPTITISATDACSGVARTEYSLDNGATWQPYEGTITIGQEGTTTVLFRSVDRAGNVETAGSRTFMVDTSDPTVQLNANPSIIWPPNGKMKPVTLAGSGADAVSGLSQVSYVVTDEYGMPLSIGSRGLTGSSANWSETLLVEARRNGNDHDGRLYRIVATISDAAGRTSTATVDVIVPHDRGN